MAEERSVPNVGSPKPEGKGQWCVYRGKNGEPIGVGKIVGKFLTRNVFFISFQEGSSVQMDTLKIDQVLEFRTPDEAIGEFVRATDSEWALVRADFLRKFPSQVGIV